MGMQAVDLAIQNGVDLDGTPIPQKMLDLYNRIMDEENKRQRTGVKKSMRNRCVKTGSKHFDKETLNQLLICLLYTSPSPRDRSLSRMPSSG